MHVDTDHWAQHLNKTSWDLQRSQCDNIILQTDLDGREDISKENQSNDSPHNTLHLLAQQLGIVHNLVFRVQGGGEGRGGEGRERGKGGGREGRRGEGEGHSVVGSRQSFSNSSICYIAHRSRRGVYTFTVHHTGIHLGLHGV